MAQAIVFRGLRGRQTTKGDRLPHDMHKSPAFNVSAAAIPCITLRFFGTENSTRCNRIVTWYLENVTRRQFVRRAIPALLLLAVTIPGLSQVLVNGAGATFPYPIYAKWFDEFHKKNPQAQINYQSIGSGGGIRQLLAGTVDFGASDSPMTDEQLSKSPTRVLHFPTVLGAVVATYNLPGVTQELNFTPEALSGIYLGTVTKWNDPVLAKANPRAKLPSAGIIPVRRSDGS